MEEWEIPWGDKLTLNSSANKFRIIFWNCGGFPNDRDHPKNNLIRSTIAETHADVAALAEINTSWKMLKPADRLHERTWGWFSAMHISHAYAVDFPSASANQAGGSAILSVNSSVHYVMEKSADRWGRWCSTKFRGTNDHTFRVIAAYRCVRNIHGPLSVWNQLRYLMDLQRIADDPIERFDSDLQQFVQSCISAGEQIILGIDANEDVRHGTLTTKMMSLGLKEICTHRHGPSNPSTYARGSVPIDAIYVTPNMWNARCGYLPVISDHRVLWIDIPHNILFGRRLSSIPLCRPQRLVLNDPRVVGRYTKILSDQLASVKFLERLQELQACFEKSMSATPDSKLLQKYEELDKTRLDAILHANKACRRLKMGQVAFSPSISIAWTKIRAWKLVRRKKMGGRVNSRYLRRELKAANITDISLMTIEDVDEQLATAWLRYKTLKKQALSLRATWLEEVAQARAAEGKAEIAQVLKNLMNRERQRQEARHIKSALQPATRKGLSSIEILDSNGNLVELSTQNDIEEALLQELKTRFNQAQNTPFQIEPLLQDTGPRGELKASREILQGRYKPPDNTDEWAVKLIPFLKQVIPTATINDLTPEQYAAGWKKVRERTSAGISGITIPHMKAHGTSVYLTQIDTIMANLPYRFGFSPSRWRRGLDVMIEKKPGVSLLSSLRAILLYEADFNQNNKRLGRDVLFRAEDAKAVAVEQYGSRKHMSASDQSLNKALTFDIWRQLRQRGALCCNDAKACYDRISHNVASLCLQRVGMPIQPIVSMFESITMCEQYLESQKDFSAKIVRSRYRAWAKGLGASFTSAISRLSSSLVGFAFVDDTDLVTSGPDMSLADVLSRIQQSLTAWEGGIRATGGAIEPKKSHWYLDDFDWRDGDPYYRNISETGGQLRVRDLNGELQTLPQMEPWQAERTLGVRIAPDGNMEAQFDWMLDTARKWGEKIRSGHLPRHLTWLAWRLTILKTLEYPLTTTTLSKKQCDKLTSIILAQTALPRVGILRSFPRALLHASPRLAGLDVPNLYYVEQGVSHILRLIRYSKSKHHSTGVLLRQTCEALKLELGTNGPVLSNSWILEPLATNSWIKSTWQFACEHGIRIVDDIPDFRPIRVFDQLLIPSFCALGFRGKSLHQLNQCRMFLQVTWLSELTTADGIRIEESVLQAPFCSSYLAEFLYPNQSMPPPHSWKIWNEALSRLCVNGRLRKPLGPFLRTEIVQWWHDAQRLRLYQAQPDGSFNVFRKAAGSRTRACNYKYIFTENSRDYPSGLLPASATVRSAQAYITGIGSVVEIPRSPEDRNWILQNVQFPKNLTDEWGKNLTNISAVSDGSFKQGHGSAAWIVVISPSCQIIGSTAVPGKPEDQSAYRSELTGIYGIAMTIRHLEQFFNLTGAITVGCDGLSALNKARLQTDFIDPNEPHFDLIMAIRHVCNESSWTWDWIHVKGHQDDSKQEHELDAWSLWNIQMDTAAKKHWEVSKHTRIRELILGEPWQTFVENKKITSSMRTILRNACTSGPAIQYWSKKMRFGPYTPQDIDWDSFGAAMKASPTARQHWISKTITGFCATGRMMRRRRERETDACPRCGEPEDVEHIWRCGYDTEPLWNKAINNLRIWMDDNFTHPQMRDAIIHGLNSWRSGAAETFSTSIPWLQELTMKQQQCGWRNFFEGLWISDWHIATQRYYSMIATKKSPRRWTSALIRKMWLIAWDLWEHRNGYLHDKETSIVSQQVDADISDQFALGLKQLDIPTRALFQGGLAKVLAKPLEVKQQWLRRVMEARHNSALGQASFQSERQVMAQWLGLRG